jgi:hypothetical protein
MYEA